MAQKFLKLHVKDFQLNNVTKRLQNCLAEWDPYTSTYLNVEQSLTLMPLDVQKDTDALTRHISNLRETECSVKAKGTFRLKLGYVL